MNNYPLISLIIPCYNSKHTLEKCLDSVIRQSYNNLEIIIIDDGSTDGTSKICEDFQRNDERIKVFKQENSGVSKARNKGVELATGEYICFVDSDDWVETNYCSELYNLLVNENVDIAIIEAIYEDENGKVVFNKPISSEKVFEGKRALALLLEDRIIQSHPWGKLYKTFFLKNVYFPENLKCFEDYSTLFKIFDKAEKVAKSNDKLYHYIQHDDSLSHNLSPETAYYFYLAIMEVFKFWESTTQVKNQRRITKSVIRKLLMVLKRILRNTTKEEMYAEKEKIRQSFKLFLRYPATDIGLEYYFYLRMYYYYPNLYTKLILNNDF
ncbi:glycosyltransferase involved in cell wall biosynthesis [Chryseobacterium rhizosphaerae]|uniref:glycosyltransferase family 2 protein n=1 Tax=Chryseobacterium rhizosphaerae TaxID=395937 RepID=UPI0006905AB9|nr:glycosyltransferase family 2 protein [Chryseobacterium rhizosphaerae]MDR6546845.1 glycosyltransferase involved in cell wall biosynthesis [Chryseobacterium rhizosphaerae]